MEDNLAFSFLPTAPDGLPESSPAAAATQPSVFFPEGDNNDDGMLLADGQLPMGSLFAALPGEEDGSQEDLYSPASATLVPADSGVVSQSSPSDGSREDSAEVVSEPPSCACPPDAPQAPQCARCRVRLEEMRASGSETSRRAAALWEAHWRADGAACFGACESQEFCTRHGYPLPQCVQRFPGQQHKVAVYRGRWVGAREKAPAVPAPAECPSKRPRPSDAPAAVPAPAVEPPVAATAAATATAEIGACECACRERLGRLLAAPWVEAAPAFAGLVRAQWAASARGCLGFCQTPYLCRVHACPAVIVAGRHPSRYLCLHGSHDGIANKGRHHADYCFYCADPACCGGKWYSRDETHARTLRRHQRADSEAHAAATGVAAAVAAPGTVAEERVQPEREYAPLTELAVPESASNANTNTDDSDDVQEDVKEEDDEDEEKTVLVATTTSTSSSVEDERPKSVLVTRWRGLRARHAVPRRCTVLALAAAACVLVATALAACTWSGALRWPPRAVPSRGGAGGAATAALQHWQLCWALEGTDGAQALRQEHGCRRCSESGAEVRCSSGGGGFTVAAVRSKDPMRFVRVRLDTADGLFISAGNVSAPWAFQSSDARRRTRISSGVISELVVEDSSNVLGGRAEARTVPPARARWFGFLAPLE